MFFEKQGLAALKTQGDDSIHTALFSLRLSSDIVYPHRREFYNGFPNLSQVKCIIISENSPMSQD